MQKKVRQIISFVLLCLIGGILMTMLSCTPKQPDTPDVPDVPTLVLAEQGQCLYRVVRSDLLQTGSPEVQAALDVRNGLKAVLGSELAIATDWEDKDNHADIKEILVGKTNRAESESVYAALGADEYAIRVIGNKIVIAGSTDELLRHAVTVFLRDYCGYISASVYTAATELRIPETLSIQQVYTVPPQVAVYVTDLKHNYAETLVNELRAASLEPTLYSIEDTDPADVLDANRTDLVIVVGASALPNTMVNAMQKYLNNSGRLLLLGGPTLETVLYELDGKWYSRNDYALAMIDSVDEDNTTTLLDLTDPSTVKKAGRSTNNTSNAYEATIADYDLYETDAQLYHWVENMSSWDMLSFSNLSVPKKGHNAMGFYAMPGDDNTGGISVEIVDSHGARWYANVTFTDSDWAYYLLEPTDFIWWKDGAQPQSDVPSFDDIVRVQLGFANSYRNNSIGDHSYFCSSVMLYSTEESLPAPAGSFVLDAVAPLYELYPVTNAKTLGAYENQMFVSARDYVVPSSLFSCAPGRQGAGFDKGTTSRFIPLIRVTDAKGMHAGYAAWMHVYYSTAAANGKMEGAIVGTFSADSNDFYNANGIAAVVEASRAMTGTSFIIDGGTTEYIYVEPDTDTITAGVNYVADETAEVVATVDLYAGDKLLSTVSSESTAVKPNNKGICSLSGTYDVSGGKPDRAVVTLKQNGRVVDTVEQEISYWAPKPAEERSFIYTEDGYFKKDGDIISFFGVNYMPSYGMAEANGSYFEHYVSDAAYDPTVISYDLARIKDIGMNAVSIFVYYDHVKNCNNILDLINKCEQLGIYVDLSIRPYAYPLREDYSYEQVQTMVQRLRFHENDNIIAYDIAWEPRIGTYQSTSMYIGRQHWDEDWVEWIEDNYGSLSHAESLWGVRIPRNADGVPVITDEMLDNTTSTYRKAVATYYRFIDEIVAADLQKNMTAMNALAPEQMFSFRMSMSGSALRTAGYMPSTHCFDFQSLASTMAFMEPEGYSLNASDEAALQIAFANAYARYTQPESPVVWKEYGRHCWTGMPDGNFHPDSQLLQSQADYYAYTLDYCLNAYTSGMFCWFYAGGFRIGENSDYGILTPDGSDRPVTALLREYAPKFIEQGARVASAKAEIAVERDDYTGGLFGMFEAVKGKLAEAHEAGKYVVFVNKKQSSADEYAYADELLSYAVGGTKAEGQYPLRYVGGQIKNVEIVNEGGNPVAKITVCNTKQSTWRAGSVSVVSVDGSRVSVDATIDTELSYLEETVLSVPVTRGAMILRFEIDGKLFGMRYSMMVK